MKAQRLLLPALTFCWFLTTSVVRGEELFAKTVGSVPVGDLVKRDEIQVPFMSWGGDVGLLMANGGATTKPDSLYGKHGLKLKLTLGDDFVAQVRDYLSGKSPFLRGTLGQIALAAEVLAADRRTEPIVFLQMTWSAGDHLVAREYIKKPADLRGKKIALMRHGPHLSLLDDVLRNAELEWNDVKIIWTDDVLGAKGPMTLFKNDTNIAACLVITPEMQALTGGLKQKGTGAEGTIKGASVLISTADQKSAIADVLACRKDFFTAQRPLVEKLTAGYLKACEELVDLRTRAAEDKVASTRYKAILKLTRENMSRAFLENDAMADGLIGDALLVGLPGNVRFFTERGNTQGFTSRLAAGLDLAVGQGYAKKRAMITGPDFDYGKIKTMGSLKSD